MNEAARPDQVVLPQIRPRPTELNARVYSPGNVVGEPPPDRSSEVADSTRALLSDEAGRLWLSNILQEQRRASERQIMRMHEMLRDHFSASLQACLRPHDSVLKSYVAARDSWDPDNWELELDGGGRMYGNEDGWSDYEKDGSTTSSLHGHGNMNGNMDGNGMKVMGSSSAHSAGKEKLPRAAAASEEGAAPAEAATATERLERNPVRQTSRTSSNQRAAKGEAPGRRQSSHSSQSSGRSNPHAGDKGQVDTVDLKNANLPHWLLRGQSSVDGNVSSGREVDRATMDWLMTLPLDFAAVFLIIANTVFMMTHSMFIGYKLRVQLGLEPDVGWHGAEDTFEIGEIVFTLLFLLELILRLCWNGVKLLKDPLNAVDAFVVLITTLDSFVFSRFDFKAGISAIRLIRMVKLGKTFRFAKALKMIEPLRILLKTITASVASLFWSMTILFLFMLVAAILATQMIQGYIQDESNDLNMRMWCEHHYGNVMKSLWTMFMITMSGGWPGWVAPLVHEVSVWYSLLFGMYVTLVVFAVIRVITALFLKETLAQAAKDADALFKERIRKKSLTMRKLTEIFHMADANKDNVLCEAEFNRALHDPAIVKLFYELEMEPHDLEGIFHLLDDGNSEVELDEFLSGIMKMKGLSRATDLLILQHDNRKMLAAVQALEEQTLSAVAELRQKVVEKEARGRR